MAQKSTAAGYLKRHRWAPIALAVVVLLAAFAIWQFITLRAAHSSFDAYAAFRGCAQITSQTDATGTCVTTAGDTITIVKIDDRWFLQGDGPGVW